MPNRQQPTREDHAAAPDSRRANFVLGVLFVVFAVNFVDRNILYILAEPIKLELELSDAEVGMLAGAFAIFYTFAGFPIARWADRGSRRTIIALGLGVWSAMTAAGALARTFPQLLLARVGVGIGEAACTPAAHSLISDYFPPERRGRAFAIYGMGAAVGGLVGYLIGGFVNEALGWRMALLVVGAPGVVLAFVVRGLIVEPERGASEVGRTDRDDRPTVREATRALWKLRTIRHLMVGSALHAFAIIGVGSFHAVFFMRVHALDSAEAATVLAMMGLFGSAVGNLSGGVACDAAGRRDLRWYLWLPALCTAVSVPVSAFFYFAPSVALAALLGTVATGLGSFYAGPLVAMTQALVPLRMRALASAVFLFSNSFVGMGIGPVAVGMTSDWLQPRFGVESIRYALLIVVFTNVWAAFHLHRAARTLREEVAANV